MKTVILGTKNPGKIREIARLLASHGVELLSLTNFDDVPDVLEDGETFQANAEKKATVYANAFNQWVIAEDSGICVNALDDAPGIYSARFAGENASDDDNNRKLTIDLQNTPWEKRTAFYVCHTCVSDPEGTIRLNVEARCSGFITEDARGTNGFGYDPFFLIAEYHRTFGELPDVVKNHISHRSKAFERLTRKIATLE